MPAGFPGTSRMTSHLPLDMSPLDPIRTGAVLDFIFHNLCSSIYRFLHFRCLSISFSVMLQSAGLTTFISRLEFCVMNL